MCGNFIGYEGAKSISNMEKLTDLDIRDNEVSDSGAKMFIQMKQLKILRISEYVLSSEGVLALKKWSYSSDISIHF